MANTEQLAILKQGVAAWNKWREEHPDAKIDLQGARLKNMELSRANFRYADIRGVNFTKSILIESDFSEANTGVPYLYQKMCFYLPKIFLYELFVLFSCNVYFFSSVLNSGKFYLLDYGFIKYIFCENISELAFQSKIVLIIILLTVIVMALAKFIIPMFFITNFSFSDLTDCIFYKNDLSDVSFYKANIRRVCWNGVIIPDDSFSFQGTILSDRYLLKLLTTGKIRKYQYHDMYSCINELYFLTIRVIKEIIFKKETISTYGNLSPSLKGKKISGGYLVDFDLRDFDLRETDLMQANLSGADITGAKLWGSARDNWIIDGIRCDYIYWDEAGKQRTPPDRNFRPGEFEELYKQLPTFEYVFANGFTPLDPLIMDRVVQAVNERHKEFSLELVNFDKRGQPHATFTVCRLDYVEKAREQITAGYEASKGSPEQQAQLMAAVLGLIENQNKLIDKIPSSRELTMGDTYQIYGGQIGAIGQSASASGNIFQQITAELPRVHEEMRRSAANPEQKAAAEDVAKAAQAAQQQNEPAVRQHLKNAGKFALDCAQKIGAEALAEYLKKMTLGL